ncbi:MAG: hypothetical protein NVSMB3_01120 [Acidobacteriaceae bacterium]
MQPSCLRRRLQSRSATAAATGALLLACGIGLAQPAPLPARSVPLLLPGAIAYDASGNLYIAETQRHTIRRVDPLGNITSFAGDGTQGFGGDNAQATAAQLNSPQGVAVDAGANVYLADSGNNRIRRVDAVTHQISTVAGDGRAAFGGDGGSAANASLNLPRAICLDATGKNLYIADTRNHRIRHVDLATGTIETVAGNGVQGSAGEGVPATGASLDSPESLTLDAQGNLYLAETHNHRVRRIDRNTKIISTVLGVGVSGASGTGPPGAAGASLLPRGLTTDPDGNLYVADAANHRTLRLDGATGLLSTAAGDATQGFAGDSGAATSASLNSPRALAISPGGLLTIADSGNQRVRQLQSTSPAAASIETIAGLGASIPGRLTLSAPAVTAYGSGSVTASLQAGATASGQITFLDVSLNSGAVIGRGILQNGIAAVSTASLPPGHYRILATYSGDASHPAAQSSTSSLTVSQLVVRAVPAFSSMVYGSALPILTGSLEGVLPQDAGRVTALFSTAVTPASPAGSYPISIALTGEAAGNYVIDPASSNFAVTPANSSTSLQNQSPGGSFTGTVQVQVNSATTGTPTGLITLLDNGAVLQKMTLSGGGSAIFANIPLTPGSHTLDAVYSGEQNFLPSSSTPLTASIAPPPSADFLLTANEPSSQLLSAGASVSYTLSVQTIGAALSSPIALAVSNLPAFTRAAFTPAYLPPGAPGKTTPVTLTITSLASAALQEPRPGAWSPSSLFALAFPIMGLLYRRRSGAGLHGRTLALGMLVASLSAALVGCGDRINSSGQGSALPLSYTLTVTGTATGPQGAPLQHSADLILTMSSAR